MGTIDDEEDDDDEVTEGETEEFVTGRVAESEEEGEREEFEAGRQTETEYTYTCVNKNN